MRVHRVSFARSLPAEEPPDVSLRSPWAVLALLTGAQTAMSVGAYLWGPLAPFLVEAFALSTAQVGALSSAFYLVASFVAVPAGMAVDRYGGRIGLVGCQLVLGGALLAFAGAPGYGLMLTCAGLAGLGNGAINQAGARGVVLWFPGPRRGLAMGLRQTGNMLGGALAAALVPVLADAFGWRAAASAVALLALTAAGVSGLLYADPPGSAAPPRRGGALAGLTELVRRPVLLTLLLLAPVLAYGQIAMTTFYALYLTDAMDYDPQLAGRCLTAGMLAAAGGRVLWGWVGDRFFPHARGAALALIMALSAVAAGLFIALPAGAPVWQAALLAGLFGATAMGWHALLLVVIAENAGASATATAFGLFINAAWAGWIIGPVAFGALVDGPGWDWAWASVVASGVLCALVLGSLSWRRRRAAGA